MIGEVIHTTGHNLSFILNLVNRPNAYSPRRGPYVYPATLKIELTTLESFISLNRMMIRNIAKEKPICVLVFIILFSDLLISIPRMSTQKEVVKAVRAESADEYAAAVIPNRKKILATSPK